MSFIFNYRKLTSVIVGCLIVVISLEIVTHFFEVTMINANKGFTNLINIAGKQRMLSQRIALFSSHKAIELRAEYTEDLQVALKELQDINGKVEETIRAKDLTLSDLDQKLLDDVNQESNIKVDKFAVQVAEFMTATSSPQREKVAKEILIHSQLALKVLDDRVALLTRFSKESYERYFKIENLLFYTRTTLIIFLFMLIIIPASRRAKLQLQEMAKLNHELKLAKARSDEYTQVKSDFFARMSHELRTPINAIIGYSEILHEDLECTNQQKDLNKVLVSARHLLGMINEILEISKIEANKTSVNVKQFNFYDLCNEVADIAEPLAQNNHNKLRYVYSIKDKFIESDPDKIKQSMLNILSNAFKFTKHGEVLLEIIDHEFSHEYIKISISDTGLGMTKEQQKRIFEPFMQATKDTSHTHGGTGLGLSITKSFVESVNGIITLESSIGNGSKFTMLIPKKLELADEDQDAIPQDHPPAKAS